MITVANRLILEKEIQFEQIFSDTKSQGIIRLGSDIVGFKDKNIIYIAPNFYDLDKLIYIGKFLKAHAEHYTVNQKGQYKIFYKDFIIYLALGHVESTLLEMFVFKPYVYTEEVKTDGELVKFYKELEHEHYKEDKRKGTTKT